MQRMSKPITLLPDAREPAHLLHPGLTAPPAIPAPQGPVRASWARHLDELREAQRLRHQIFALEMGATLNTPLPGHDIDEFDDYC